MVHWPVVQSAKRDEENEWVVMITLVIKIRDDSDDLGTPCQRNVTREP